EIGPSADAARNSCTRRPARCRPPQLKRGNVGGTWRIPLPREGLIGAETCAPDRLKTRVRIMRYKAVAINFVTGQQKSPRAAARGLEKFLRCLGVRQTRRPG